MSLIKNLPKELRPREKLVHQGALALTNAELVSIILGVGTIHQDVGDIAEKIFPNYAPHILYTAMDPCSLSKELQIPLSHACKLIAFFELSGRYHKQTEHIYLNKPSDAYTRFKYLSEYSKEHLIGIYLNTRNMIIHEEIISIGTVDTSLISPKEILEPAILKHATGLIICHNHPSGDPTPSDEDMQTTKTLQKACAYMHIAFFDHIIIGKHTFASVINHP